MQVPAIRISVLTVVASLLAGCGAETHESHHDNGNLKERYTSKDFDGQRVLHGDYISWHPNGVREQSVRFERGRIDGTCRVWYDNGELKVKGHYANGKRDGEWLLYNPDGSLKGCARFSDGILDGDLHYEDELATILCTMAAGHPTGKFMFAYDKACGCPDAAPKHLEGFIKEGQPVLTKTNWGMQQPWDKWFHYMTMRIDDAVKEEFTIKVYVSDKTPDYAEVPTNAVRIGWK